MREKGQPREKELPPEDSVLIRLLLHLLIASHWGCREISVACHYACRSDFSFTQLAYRCTIRSRFVFFFLFLKRLPPSFVFLSFSLSCTLQWKAVKVIGKVRLVYKLIKMSCYWLSDVSIRCVRMQMELFSLCSARFGVFYEGRRSQIVRIYFPSGFTFSLSVCHFIQCLIL